MADAWAAGADRLRDARRRLAAAVLVDDRDGQARAALDELAALDALLSLGLPRDVFLDRLRELFAEPVAITTATEALPA